MVLKFFLMRPTTSDMSDCNCGSAASKPNNKIFVLGASLPSIKKETAADAWLQFIRIAIAAKNILKAFIVCLCWFLILSLPTLVFPAKAGIESRHKNTIQSFQL